MGKTATAIRQRQTGQPEASNSRETLLQIAIDLVWNASYDSIGVNEICRRAEVTKGCFYYYFNTKADLFYAAYEQYWQELKPQLDCIVSPTLNSYEQLCALAELSRKKQQLHSDNGNPVAGCPFLSTAALAGHREPLISQAGQEITAKFLIYMETIVKGLLEQGYAQSSLSAEQIARLVNQYYQGIMQYGRTFQSREFVERDIGYGMAQLLGLKSEYVEQLCAAYRLPANRPALA